MWFITCLAILCAESRVKVGLAWFTLRVCSVASIVSDSATSWTVAPRFLCPWDSPGKNTGVGCHGLLWGIFLSHGSNLGLLCLLHGRRILYCCVTGDALDLFWVNPFSSWWSLLSFPSPQSISIKTHFETVGRWSSSLLVFSFQNLFSSLSWKLGKH